MDDEPKSMTNEELADLVRERLMPSMKAVIDDGLAERLSRVLCPEIYTCELRLEWPRPDSD